MVCIPIKWAPNHIIILHVLRPVNGYLYGSLMQIVAEGL